MSPRAEKYHCKLIWRLSPDETPIPENRTRLGCVHAGDASQPSLARFSSPTPFGMPNFLHAERHKD